MKHVLRGLALAASLTLLACSEDRPPGEAGAAMADAATPGSASQDEARWRPAVASPAATGAAGAASSSSADRRDETASRPQSARPRELVNPEPGTMVLLYHHLAGIAAPLDQWVEADQRVTSAPGVDKPARREQVRSELAAAQAGVQDVGSLRLSLSAQLSDYDPGYGEFTLSALAPSASIPFRAWDREVTLRFGNGRDAQTWAVPAERAQAIEDSFRYGRGVVLDVLLRIDAVQAATRGGQLIADVVEYEIRTQQGNQILGRVKPTPR